MSVASELNRIKNAKNDLKASINAKTDSGHQITNETIDEYADFVDSITSGGGADLSDYFEPTISVGTSSVSGVMSMLKTIPEDTIVEGISLNYAFGDFQGTTIPLLDTSNVTSMISMFANATNLLSVPLLDTSNVTNTGSMFQYCDNLVTVPILDLSSVTFMRYMFRYCPSLSDTSLDNILQMCIGATSYSSTKTLAFLGLTSTDYPVNRIEALPHYSAFTSAGWTIGY